MSQGVDKTPAQDCPTCPRCGAAKACPAAATLDGQRVLVHPKNHATRRAMRDWPPDATLFCPDCLHAWIADDADTERAWAAWRAWAAENVERRRQEQAKPKPGECIVECGHLTTTTQLNLVGYPDKRKTPLQSGHTVLARWFAACGPCLLAAGNDYTRVRYQMWRYADGNLTVHEVHGGVS